MRESIELADGRKVALIGLGTCFATSDQMESAVAEAIRVGYRLIDAAPKYGNETGVGKGIAAGLKEAGVEREDLFVTSKLYHTDHRAARVVPALKKTLADLNLNYIDCWMMHAPWAFEPKDSAIVSCEPKEDKFGAIVEEVDILETWREMERCVDLGLAKSIAVCNFSGKMLENLVKSCRIKPVLNQIESHLYFNNQRLNSFCQKLNIPLMAFHPIGETRVKRDEQHLRDDPELAKLAFKLETSPVKLMLRFHIERGVIPIPKSSNPEHIRENFEALSMTPLSEETMKSLMDFDCNMRVYSHKWIAKLSKFYPFNDDI